jgi:hypothetical protein
MAMLVRASKPASLSWEIFAEASSLALRAEREIETARVAAAGFVDFLKAGIRVAGVDDADDRGFLTGAWGGRFGNENAAWLDIGFDVGWKPKPFFPLLNTLFEAIAGGSSGGSLAFFAVEPGFFVLLFVLLHTSSVVIGDLGSSSSSDGGE